MTDLLSQLQTATEGSRPLDKAVGEYLNIEPDCYSEYGYADPAKDAPREYAHYTTNLQDAVSLVPEGWSWRVTKITNDRHAIDPVGSGYGADVLLGDGAPTYSKHYANPALALCIAIIKAHESKAEAA